MTSRLSRRPPGLRDAWPTSKRFIAAAHARGMRVITELVMNHTSDQHPVVPAGARGQTGSP